MNSLTLYLVLVTAIHMPNTDCVSDTCQAWMHTAWVFPAVVKINQQLIIWKISKLMSISAHYKFCDVCRPYMFVEWAAPPMAQAHNQWLIQLVTMLRGAPQLYIVKAVVAGPVIRQMQMHRSIYSIKNLKLDIRPTTTLGIAPRTMHALALSAKMTGNTSLTFTPSFPEPDLVLISRNISLLTERTFEIFSTLTFGNS